MWWLALRPLEVDGPADAGRSLDVGARHVRPVGHASGWARADTDTCPGSGSGSGVTAAVRGCATGADEADRLGGPDSEAAAWETVPAGADRRLLGWRLLRFTPRVTEAGDAVLAEVSASLRLFKGRAALVAQVQALADAAGWGHLGQAPTADAALALSRHGGGLAGGANWRAGIDALPLSTVPALAEEEATLSQLGCRTLRDVRRLPRPGLARRFGARLLDELDAVYGTRPGSPVWITLPEVFDDTLELPGRVDNAAALLDGAQHLLQRLQAWLVARRAGVRAVVLRWRHDLARRAAGRGGKLEVRSALPARDVSHLSRLLAEKLNQTQLAGPVGELGLRATEIELLPDAPESFWRDATQAQDSRVQLLERLGARLGADKVRRPQLLDDHRPGWLQSWVPVEASAARGKPAGNGAKKRRAGAASRAAALPVSPASKGSASNAAMAAPAAPAAQQPTAATGARLSPQALAASASDSSPPPRFPLPCWLLESPVGLAVVAERPHYRGPLSLLAGPHRVRGGWWQAGGWVDRDHYVAASPGAGLVWIYRERPRLSGGTAGGWFLQGFYG